MARGATAAAVRGGGAGGRDKVVQEHVEVVDAAPTSRTWTLAVLLALLCLVVYKMTMFPGLSGGDSGELIANVWNLGVAHPPGYPLFTMVAHVFARYLVPFAAAPSPAARVAMFSIVCSAGCTVVLFFATRLWILHQHQHQQNHDNEKHVADSCAALCAAMFAFSRVPWHYSIQAEVFALNNLFVASLLLVALVHYANTTTKTTTGSASQTSLLYFGAFLLGLGLCNQHTLVLFGFPVVVWIFFCDRFVVDVSRFARLAACGACGLLPYIYLYFAAVSPPLGSWGATNTVSGFFTHLLRREYGTFQLYSGTEGRADTLQSIAYYLSDLAQQSYCIPLVLALVGIATSLRSKTGKGKWMGVLVVASLVFYLVVFHSLSNLPLKNPLFLESVQVRFWMQPNLLVYACAGVGLASVSRLVPVSSRGVVVDAVAVVLVAVQIGSNYQQSDESANTAMEDYGRQLLQMFPPNAIALVKGDVQHNSIRYLQSVEGVRTDVRVVDQALMTWTWFKTTQSPHLPGVVFPGTYLNPYNNNHKDKSFGLQHFLQANAHNESNPVVLCGGWIHGDVPEGFLAYPWGMCLRVVPNGTRIPNAEDYWEQSAARLPKRTSHFPVSQELKHKYGAGSWERKASLDYWAAFHIRLSYALNTKKSLQTEQEQQAYAQRVMNHMIALNKEVIGAIDPEWYRNLGIAAAHAGGDVGGLTMLEAFETYVKLQKDPAKKRDVEEVRRIIEQYKEKIKQFGTPPTIKLE